MGVTLAAVVAGEVVAGAGAHGAVLAGEAEGARAGEVVDAVDAGAGVAAGVPGAVVDVGLTAGAGEAGLTATHDAFTQVQTLSACRDTEGGVSYWQKPGGRTEHKVYLLQSVIFRNKTKWSVYLMH